jgi:hypothetical protein
MPKTNRRYPVALYFPAATADLTRLGNDLRQIAELNLAAVAFEYNETNQSRFDEQLTAVLDYIHEQPWSKNGALAWIGFNNGADRSLNFALSHPHRQPQFMAQVAPSQFPGQDKTSALTQTITTYSQNPSSINRQPSTNGISCSVLLVHGQDDDSAGLANLLKMIDAPVAVRILPGQPEDPGPDRSMLLQGIAEYCATSFGQLQRLRTNSAASYWYYWLPVGLLAVFASINGYTRHRAPPRQLQTRQTKLDKTIYCAAAMLATTAIAQTVIHLGLPRVPASQTTLSLARRLLVKPHLKADFQWLANQPIWRGQRISTLVTHLDLAALQRKSFYPDLDDATYRRFVLSPIISGDDSGELVWRRQLWEDFYLHVRNETTPEAAARIVVRLLRQRMSIDSKSKHPTGVRTTWECAITDEPGFERIYVAALRSVGIASKLSEAGLAEFWTGMNWQQAPRPFQF